MSEVLQHEIGLTGEVAIRVRSGDVRLSGVAGTLARVRARGGDALRRVSFEPTPGALAVHSRSSDGLDVEVPTGVAIRLEAGSADLELRGLRGTQQYRTASGDIRGRGLAGDVTIEALSGDVDLVLDGPGRLQARTVSGDLAVRAGILAAFRGATTSGDLRVAARFEGSGPFAIETVSGDAVVAPAGPVRVETSTIAGEVRSDLDAAVEGTRGRRTVVVGAGGPTLSFRSTTGDLRLVRAVEHHDDAPMPPAPPDPPAAVPPVAPVPPADPPSGDAPGDPRLDILRDLEAGRIDVAEAEARLTALDRQEVDRG